jgi:hypothetical protein
MRSLGTTGFGVTDTVVITVSATAAFSVSGAFAGVELAAGSVAGTSGGAVTTLVGVLDAVVDTGALPDVASAGGLAGSATITGGNGQR